MAAINPVLTIAALSPIAISLFITTRLGPRIEAYRRASRATTGRVTGFLGELLGSVQAVQVATSEQHAIRHFDSLSDSRRSADLKEVLVESLVDSSSGVTYMVSIGAILLAGAELMRSGSFTVGDFALFVTFISGNQFWHLRGWVGPFFMSMKCVDGQRLCQ